MNINPLFDKWQGKRYHSLNAFLRNKFGEPVYRISLDAGFSCPNRDGTKGWGGCTYCNESGSRAAYVEPDLSITEQLKKGKAFIQKKYGAKKFIAYFQAYTNTYADINTLEKIYKEALNFPDIVAIAIGTRPDCIDNQKLDLLEEISRDVLVILEMGAQSMKEETLLKINRQHTAKETLNAFTEARKRKSLHLLSHLIFGLPDETADDMISSVKILLETGIDAFKFHHLYIEKGSTMENDWKKGKIKLLSRDEYINILLSIIPILPERIVIHRLFGDCNPQKLIAPEWTIEKANNLHLFERRLEEMDVYQGKIPYKI